MRIILLVAFLLAACGAKPSSPTSTVAPPATVVLTSSPVPKPSVTPTLAPTAIPDPGEYIVIAQFNLWYYGPGCYGGFEMGDCSGKRSNPFLPALGDTYVSTDPEVIEQQIDWAADYGVDAFSLEWVHPRGTEGSLEPAIDDAFLKAPNLDRIRWVIFYDFYLRVIESVDDLDLSNGMDFDDPEVYNTFVADFEHFAQKYFGETHYLSIDGRPLVYIWGTWNATGRFAEAFEEARQKVAALGYDVYIVGDIIQANTFNQELASVYDANTNFLFPLDPVPADVGQAARIQADVFENWQAKIQGLQVAGRQENVILQPGWAPQYDDRLYRTWQGQESIYVPAMSRDQVVAIAEVARQYAQPAGSLGWKLIWINTWNNWAESTTIEPTIDQGPKYPMGNYHFDFLEIVREVFGAETFGYSPP
jgi:hypothetical protein